MQELERVCNIFVVNNWLFVTVFTVNSLFWTTRCGTTAFSMEKSKTLFETRLARSRSERHVNKFFATFFTLTNGDFPVKGDSGTGPE